MTPVWLPENVAADWLCPRIGATRGLGPMEAMGIMDKDQNLSAVFAFHDWQPEYGTCQISAASTTPKWANVEVINAVLSHAFDVKGCQMVVALNSSDNLGHVRFWKAIGADEIVIPRGRGRNLDEHVVTLTDDAWRQSRFYKRT